MGSLQAQLQRLIAELDDATGELESHLSGVIDDARRAREAARVALQRPTTGSDEIEALRDRVAAARERVGVVLEQARKVRRDATRHAFAPASGPDRSTEEFLGVLSHELRQPLNAILGWAHILRSPTEPELASRGLDVIHRNASALARMVSDVLDFSRIQNGQLSLDLEATDLAAVAASACESARPNAEKQGTAIDFRVEGAPAWVAGDPERLQQVISNLIENALRYSSPGGAVTVLVGAADGSASVTVLDEGPGIPATLLPHVFERFRQGGERRGRGLGLGLTIVRSLVEAHNGIVTADNRPDRTGALITVRIPLAR